MNFRRHTKIFTVFSFLRLKSADVFWYQYTYPTIVFLIVFVGCHLLGDGLLKFEKLKLISDINSLMGILVGFYIAALAAVSSFANESLDQIMKGRAPTLESSRGGRKIIETLTRRRFLAVIFGYCATLAVVLYIFGVIQVHFTIEQSVDCWLKNVVNIIEQISWAIYVWAISSLLVVTLLGLHYLVERMHRV